MTNIIKSKWQLVFFTVLTSAWIAIYVVNYYHVESVNKKFGESANTSQTLTNQSLLIKNQNTIMSNQTEIISNQHDSVTNK